MTTTFLQSVGAVLTSGLKAVVEINGVGDGKIKLIYSPEIGPTPDNASDEVIKLRSAISRPLIITGTPDEVELAFAQKIEESAHVVKRGLSALDEIERLSSAAITAARSSKSSGSPASTGAIQTHDAGESHNSPSDTSLSQTTTANASGPLSAKDF
ncbi:PRTRC system protein E [Pseudomonas sp. zjy_13]|uniref:PRTRC system protein E n=1 Tax=Pseudomonas sp. zjy_13 TaxID=3367263 RepID=UPI00370BB67D